MKITTDQLNKIIVESMVEDPRILNVLMDILDVQKESLEGIKDLDISMDYVASALTGVDPLDMQITQATMGRKTPVKGMKNEDR